MAWTLDAKVENKTKTTDPIVTSFTTGVGAKLLVVSLVVDVATGLATSVTFDGTALTLAVPGSLLGKGAIRIYYLLDPPIKTANISVVNGGANSISMVAASFIHASSGALRSTSNLEQRTDTADPVSRSITNITTGDLVYAAIISGAATWNPTATTGTQLYDADVGAVGAGAQFILATDTSPLTLGWTFATAASYDVAAAVFTIPITGSGEYISMQRGIKNKPRQAPFYTDDAI